MTKNEPSVYVFKKGNMTNYSQKDSKWKADLLGQSSTITLGERGCMIASTANILNEMGATHPELPVINPQTLNQFATKRELILKSGDALLGKIAECFGIVVKRLHGNLSVETIRHHKLKGNGVMVRVNSSFYKNALEIGNPAGTHFVAVAEVTATEVIFIDPGRSLTKVAASFEKVNKILAIKDDIRVFEKIATNNIDQKQAKEDPSGNQGSTSVPMITSNSLNGIPKWQRLQTDSIKDFCQVRHESGSLGLEATTVKGEKLLYHDISQRKGELTFVAKGDANNPGYTDKWKRISKTVSAPEELKVKDIQTIGNKADIDKVSQLNQKKWQSSAQVNSAIAIGGQVGGYLSNFNEMSTTQKITQGGITAVSIGVAQKFPTFGTAISVAMVPVSVVTILSKSELSKLERTADLGRMVAQTALTMGSTYVYGQTGAIIGTSILPGVGSIVGGLIGGIIGGFSGSTIGKALNRSPLYIYGTIKGGKKPEMHLKNIYDKANFATFIFVNGDGQLYGIYTNERISKSSDKDSFFLSEFKTTTSGRTTIYVWTHQQTVSNSSFSSTMDSLYDKSNVIQCLNEAW